MICYFGQCSGLKSSKTIKVRFRWRNSSHHCIQAMLDKTTLTQWFLMLHSTAFSSLMLTCTDDRRPLGRGISLSSCLLLSASHQPLLLLLLGLWPVLVCQLEQLCGWGRGGQSTLQVNLNHQIMATHMILFCCMKCISDLGGMSARLIS